MSLRRYNIEKRKEKIERDAKNREQQEARRAQYDQHKRRLIDQAFRGEDDIRSQSKTCFSKSSKK